MISKNYDIILNDAIKGDYVVRLNADVRTDNADSILYDNKVYIGYDNYVHTYN